MFGQLYSVGLILWVHVIYTTFIQHSKERLVKQIVNRFNEVITKEVYSGNQRQIQYNRMRILPEDDYCSRSDSYKYFHPDVLLEDIWTIRDSRDLPRGILRDLTFQGLIQITKSQRSFTEPRKLPIQTGILYPYFSSILDRLVTGKQCLCVFQKFNHMPGKKQLSLKQRLMNNYYRQIDLIRKHKLDQDCLQNASYIPQTFRLYKQQECKEFFNMVKTQEFTELTNTKGPQYIMKLGNEVHRGRGIHVLFPDELANFRQYYQDGAKCGRNKTMMIAQRYITNPYLYKSHKIEFRIYWFIASTNPLQVYAYTRPLIKRCAKKFDLLSKEKAAHVCNTAIVKRQKQKRSAYAKKHGIEDEEFFIDWNFEGLQDRLLAEGKIKNKQWLEDELFPQIHRMLIHLVRSASRKFVSDSRLGEFFATDFMLTDDLEIFILETNYNPQILSVTRDRVRRNYRMVMDTVELMNLYLRSRYVRMRKFIKKVLSTMPEYPSPKQIQKLIPKEDILELYRDKIDAPFKQSEKNLYRKFIDNHEKGAKRYNNLVQEKCLF